MAITKKILIGFTNLMIVKLTIVEKFINELQVAMRGTMYYNNDDIMTDYFDSAYFMGINIGKYNKPYKLTETS